MPGIVAEVALENGEGLVDFARMIEKSSPDGIPGEEYFLDHVHPSIDANRMLGLAIVDEMIKMGVATPVSTWDATVISKISERVKSNVDEAANAMALTNLSRVMTWAGKQEEALRLVERAASITTDHHTLFQMVTVLTRSGRYEEALHYSEKAARLMPEIAEVRKTHGIILAHNGRNSEALQELQSAARLDSTMIDLYYYLGLVLTDLGYKEQAERTYWRALEIEPQNANACNNLGIMLAQRGNLEAAMDLFERAVAANPNHGNALSNLERAKRLLGN